MNSCNVVGRLGGDPEGGQSGDTTYCNFSVAVNGAGNSKDETGWFNVICFGPLASAVSSSLKKGALVAVSGRLQYNTWKNPAGEKRNAIKIAAFSVDFMEPRAQNSEQTAPAANAPPADDDDPFA